MPRRRGIRVDLLVEDEKLKRFARSVLMEFHFSRHKIGRPDYPVGINAKQWLTREYPNKVIAYRRKAKQRVALLVGTDADEQTVRQRSDALSAALDGADLLRRRDEERIVLWIPKWHVETWILALLGQDVNERDNYKHAARDADVVAAATGFVDRFRAFKQDATTQVLPSLKTAFEETRRLDV